MLKGRRPMVGRTAIRLKSNFNPIRSRHYAPMSEADTRVYKTYMCLICGFIYDEAAGLPEEGIEPGTRWEDVPMNWTCPECGARKEDFEMVEL
jgi:rubredoxin